jgi:hypothetical protein
MIGSRRRTGAQDVRSPSTWMLVPERLGRLDVILDGTGDNRVVAHLEDLGQDGLPFRVAVETLR